MDINCQDIADSASTSNNDVKANPYTRIGDEYQVDVPELIRSDNYISFNQRSRLRMDEDSFSSPKKDAELDCDNKWKDIECKSFLLGLYSFGKNLRLVKEFVETRSMSDVLTYYYGKFYRSNEYMRWSQSRKLKGGRIIKKERIYLGWRQYELLSRISPHLSSNREKSLKKVSRRFANGKISLENYLFTLKEMVGISLLMGAVAIGKEKEDLTGTTIYREKKTCKKAIGKTCSSLTEDVKGLVVETTALLSIPSTQVGQTFTTLACNAEDSTKKAVQSSLCKDIEPSTEKSKVWPVKDLNKPYVSPCTDEPPTNDVHSPTAFLNSSFSTETNNHFELLMSSNNPTKEGQPVVKVQRKSSRSRELTTKALEAIALDFLGPKKRRKGMKSLSPVTKNEISETQCSSYLSETCDHLELNSTNYETGKEKPSQTCLSKSSKNGHLTRKALDTAIRHINVSTNGNQ